MARKRVLLIDDDPGFRGMMKFILWEKGFDAYVSAGGFLGLRLARRMRPDIIVLDMDMPGMKGLEVGRRLRGDPRTLAIPIVFISDPQTRRNSTTSAIWDVSNAAFATKAGSMKELVLLISRMVAPAIDAASAEIKA